MQLSANGHIQNSEETMKKILVILGGGLHCFRLAAAVLDDIIQAESVRGAVLLHCGGGRESAAGQI